MAEELSPDLTIKQLKENPAYDRLPKKSKYKTKAELYQALKSQIAYEAIERRERKEKKSPKKGSKSPRPSSPGRAGKKEVKGGDSYVILFQNHKNQYEITKKEFETIQASGDSLEYNITRVHLAYDEKKKQFKTRATVEDSCDISGLTFSNKEHFESALNYIRKNYLKGTKNSFFVFSTSDTPSFAYTTPVFAYIVSNFENYKKMSPGEWNEIKFGTHVWKDRYEGAKELRTSEFFELENVKKMTVISYNVLEFVTLEV